MDYQEDTAYPGLDGFARWDLTEAAATPQRTPDLWVPVFVRLTGSGKGPTLAEVIDQMLVPGARHILADHEREALLTERQRLTGSPDIRAVIWCRPDEVAAGPWTVLYVGPPVTLKPTAAPAGSSGPVARRGKALAKTPLLAVIDDGIGYLNARFRSAAGRTRFKAVWLQAPARLAGQAAAPNGQEVYLGRVLTRQDIDSQLLSGATEAHLYRAQNAALFQPWMHQSTNRAVGHGSHVLDLAAGAAFGDPVDTSLLGVPLLGVSLMPEVVGETSGRWLEPYLALGLRWVIWQALRAVAEPGNGNAGVPLIVNLSLGSLAGPKDGTGFIEEWIAHELARFRRLSDDTPIRIVAAYGNARRARLVANATLQPGPALVLDWCIQPDDATASFLELRLPKGAGGRVSLRIAAPADPDAVVFPAFPAPGTAQVLMRSGRRIAAVYGRAEAQFDTVLIAVAPTLRDDRASAGPDPRGAAPAGAWKISLGLSGTGGLAVSVKVLRDDTPGGFRRRGRQSWLDHSSGWQWDAEVAGWTAPGPDCPVTRAGTEVNYAGLGDPSLYFVAAAEPDPARMGGTRPTRYSSEGEDRLRTGVDTGPTLAAIGDQGRIRTGRRGTGVLTGTVALMSGTSVAAPLVARRLVELALNAGPLSSRGPGMPHDPAELAALLGLVVPPGWLPVFDRRLGAGVVPDRG